MTTASIEAHLAAKKLGAAIAADALSVLVAVEDPDGNAATLKVDEEGKLITNAESSGGPVVGAATEAKQDSEIALLTTISGKDFATQTTLAAVLTKLSADPATQTTVAAILTKLSADPATQTTLLAVLAALQAATPAGENVIGKVVGKAALIPVPMTRPNDTTAYAAGDMFGTVTTNNATNIFTLPVSRVNNGTVLINRIRAKMKGSANWALKRVKFHFFKDQPTVTTIGDNGALANMTVVTESSKIGTVTIVFDGFQTSDAFVKGYSYPDDVAGVVWTVEPSAGTQNIFAIAEVLDAVTPAAQDILTLTIEAAGQN